MSFVDGGPHSCTARIFFVGSIVRAAAKSIKEAMEAAEIDAIFADARMQSFDHGEANRWT